MSALNIVAVSGNPGTPSRTRALVDVVLAALRERVSGVQHVVDLAEVGLDLAHSSYRKQLGARAEAALGRIEAADLLVVASPVYRGSYTGLFKHVFDLVDLDALAGVPVLLAATGGSDRHALVIEHQLRPLFGFFRAVSVPTGLYATEADFEHYRLVSTAVRQRVAAAADEVVDLALARAARIDRRIAAVA
jgi:FMN reductase